MMRLRRMSVIPVLCGLAMPVWAVCPPAPGRPTCIPEAGEFEDGRAAQRCEEYVKIYAIKMEKALRCEQDPARKSEYLAHVRQVKTDFEDAMDGLVNSGPGVSVPVPPDAPEAPQNYGSSGDGMNTNMGGIGAGQASPPPNIIIDVGGDGRVAPPGSGNDLRNGAAVSR